MNRRLRRLVGHEGFRFGWRVYMIAGGHLNGGVWDFSRFVGRVEVLELTCRHEQANEIGKTDFRAIARRRRGQDRIGRVMVASQDSLQLPSKGGRSPLNFIQRPPDGILAFWAQANR